MKRTLTLSGVLIVIVILAMACGGEATTTPTGCFQLTGEGLVPIPCPDTPSLTPMLTAPDTVTIATTIPPPACSTDDGSQEALGRELFLTVPDSAAPQALWCSQCHTIEGISEGLIGPDLTHICTSAATRVPGFSAEEYIRESIVDPEAFVPEGVERASPGLMTKAITEKLTEEQVEALVAFLLTVQ